MRVDLAREREDQMGFQPREHQWGIANGDVSGAAQYNGMLQTRRD